MDEQSGILKSGKLIGEYNGFGNNGIYGKSGTSNRNYESDTGGASRFFYCAKASKSERNKGLDNTFEKELGHNRFDKCEICNGYIFQNQDRPSACKCESPKRKNNIVNGNFHPTVKPVKLMQYLVRLITPPNGKVLDPFCGSGTTGIACKLEGFEFVGMEQDPEYTKIAESRINNWIEEKGGKVQNKSNNQENTSITQTTLF
jgi:site-specific DNA-methyltransferase (adenine-specific)